LETGYLVLSVLAWRILANNEPNEECRVGQGEHSSSELIVDLIILDYMRALKLLSLMFFGVMCGPLLLMCWCINTPTPPVDAALIKKNFSKVTLA